MDLDAMTLKREPTPLEEVVLLLAESVDRLTDQVAELRQYVRHPVDDVAQAFRDYDSASHPLPWAR